MTVNAMRMLIPAPLPPPPPHRGCGRPAAPQSDEALRERVEEVMREEEVKRVSAEANAAARSAFGKSKWMSFLSKGKVRARAGGRATAP